LANSGVHVASESVPQGGTFVTVRIGTFRIVPLTLSTLQMYSVCSWQFPGLPGQHL
jgi:hypothetical protein